MLKVSVGLVLHNKRNISVLMKVCIAQLLCSCSATSRAGCSQNTVSFHYVISAKTKPELDRFSLRFGSCTHFVVPTTFKQCLHLRHTPSTHPFANAFGHLVFSTFAAVR